MAPVLCVSTSTTCSLSSAYSRPDTAQRASVVASTSYRPIVTPGQVARPASRTSTATSTVQRNSPLREQLQLPQQHQATFVSDSSFTQTSLSESNPSLSQSLSLPQPKTDRQQNSELIRLLLLKSLNPSQILLQKGQGQQHKQQQVLEVELCHPINTLQKKIYIVITNNKAS